MSTFYDRFLECGERWPENVAVEIQRGERVESHTYSELRKMAESFGRWLHEQRIEPGSRVAILADNSPRWVAVYLGTIAAGCTVVPLDTALHAEQVVKLLKDSGSSVMVVDDKHLEIARDAARSIKVGLVLANGNIAEGQRTNWDVANTTEEGRSAHLMGKLDRIFAEGPGDFRASPGDAESIASLVYTSGTTADPKGVMLTHANLIGEASAVFGLFHIGPTDALLGVLPLFHVLAQMANLFLPLVAGSRVVYLETLNTTELLRALRERNITAFAVVPQFFYLIHERILQEVAKRGALAQRLLPWLMGVNRKLRKLGINAGRTFFPAIHRTFGPRMRFLVTGGSRFEPSIGQAFYDLGIDVLQAYGLTETTGGAFVTRPGDNVIGSVGKPLSGVEGRIINAQVKENGAPASGEVAIRGAIVMKGYWNRPDATQAVLRDGWLHTGDLGYFDDDGNLFLTGREKDVIVLSNGKNIYPEEIEEQYAKSPFIKEICVMGLEARPGDATSERLHAVIVPNFDVLKQRKIVNAKEVIRFDIESLSANLASTKRLGSYEFWQEDLPRTTTRKLKRFEIEKRVRANRRSQDGSGELSPERPLTEEDQAWMERPPVPEALAVIKERARRKVDTIRPDHNLELDLGLDSMQRVELLAALEERLGGNIDESRLAEIYTVRQLVDAVGQSATAGASAHPSHSQGRGWKAVLEEPSNDPEVQALAEPQRFREGLWFLLSRLVQVIALDRFDLHVSGLENLPSQGACILSSNHQSFLDPIILGSVLPWRVFRELFEVGTSEIFGSGFLRWLARQLRVIVVDPDANLIPAMRAGAFGLRHGRILMLYPEGERSIDGPPKAFKKGAAILAIHLQVPIVPVAIEGFHDAWPRGRSFQKWAPLRLAFGKPIYPTPELEASEKAYEALTAELKSRVMSMWKDLRKQRRATGLPAAQA